MITELKLIGFKSFLHRTLQFKRLTLLTGLNSSGKSSIIQALLILEKAFKKEKNVLLDGHGSLEEMKNIFYKDALELSVFDNEKRFEVEFPGNSQPYRISTTSDFTFPEITYISANRFGPKNSIPIFTDDYNKTRIGPNGENCIQCIKTLADQPLDTKLRNEYSEGDTLLYNIRGWLNVISPNIKFDYDVNSISDSSYSTFNEYRAANVGFGLSYILPVITSLLVSTTQPNSLLIIENPEAHLHPRGQSQMAKLISLCIEVGANILIETHSDHLFDGIRIAAKNKKGFNELVQIHWFEQDKEGNTEIYSPVLLDDGRVNEWPTGFFDQFEINSSKLL
jgi:predicted ATPase